MKKLFAIVAAAGMLFVTSCAKDAAEGYAEGNDGVATFTLALENGAGTRTVSDGLSAKDLYYAVYNVSAGAFVPGYGLTTEADAFEAKETTVQFRLVKGQTYKAVFWAQSAAAEAFTLEQTADDITMTFDYEGVKNNIEDLDAFFAAHEFTLSQSGLTETITLRRPFAQINLATTAEDYAAAVAQGFVPEKSEVVLTNAATTLSLFDGSVEGDAEVTFAMNDIINEQLTGVDADGDGEAEEYQYLSMCYVLVPQEKATLSELSFTVRAEASAADVVVSDGLTSVPVQRNWRTNIVGNILLATADFTIVIDEKFDGDYNHQYGDDEWTEMPAGVEYDKANNSVKISTVAGLEWVSKVTNGVIDFGEPYLGLGTYTGQHYFKTVELEDGVEFDMTGISWQPLILALSGDQRGTFKGNGATVKNLTVTATEGGSAGFLHAFASDVSDLYLDNITVYSNYKAGALAGDAESAKITNVHITNAYIESTPWLKDGKKYDDANNVGGMVGYGQGVTIEECSIENAEVYGYRVVGGIAGHAYAATIKNNELTNVKVVANMIISGEYDGTPNEDEIAHDIYGRKNGDTTIESNTTTEVTVEIWKTEIDSVSALQALATAVNKGGTFKGQTITLTEDLDLDGVEWTPIGTSGNPFQGTFDGGGKTISKLSVNTPNKSYVGLFGNTNSGEIKNVVIEDAKIAGYLYVGVIGGNPYTSKYTDITIKGKIEVEGFAYVGGAVGYNAYGALTNITIEAEEGSYVKAYSIEGKDSYRTYVGGIVGFPGEGTKTFKNLKSNIDVYGSTMNVGGICGLAHYGLTFEDCECSGNIYITNATSQTHVNSVGGITGQWYNDSRGNVTFKNCKFTGTLNSNLEPTAGWEAWREKNKITGVAYTSTSDAGLLTIDDVDVTAEHK